jgi:hypothetical protein
MISPQNDPRRGLVLGQPRRFIKGHHRQPVVAWYRQTNRGRRVFLHVQRAEKALGKLLPPGAIVHHADGSRRDDAPLVICQDQAYHMQLHARMRIQAAGGNPWTDALCSRCHAVKPLKAFPMQRARFNGRHSYCRACLRAYEQGTALSLGASEITRCLKCRADWRLMPPDLSELAAQLGAQLLV